MRTYRDKHAVSLPRSRGLTLIELVVTVAIIAILATIAIPSYERYVSKARRAEAKGALLDLATHLERYYADNRTYTGATVVGMLGSALTEHGDYTLTIESLTANAYTIVAQPGGRQLGDDCGSFMLTSIGSKSVKDGSLSSDKCW